MPSLAIDIEKPPCQGDDACLAETRPPTRQTDARAAERAAHVATVRRRRHRRPWHAAVLCTLAAVAAAAVLLVGRPAAVHHLLLWNSGGSLRPPSELPYYGRSPPVYPSPPGNGSDARWAAAYERARALVAQMTLDERVGLTYGHPGPCAGNTAAVPRLGVPSLCFSDGPAGVRHGRGGGRAAQFVSAFPAGVHLAATFDADLMRRYGAALGREFRAQGVDVALGPVAGPLGRIARGGRNWEALGSDPYLAGVGMGAVTRGMQAAGVVATPKHFVLNEQETRRRETARQPAGPPGVVGEAVSARADDRTLHELYAFPFMDALAAGGAGAVMCAYQRANHSYACQNSKLLNGLLKTELAFAGFVVSDWDAQHAGVAAARAGLDLAMPASPGFWADGLLRAAVRNGSVEAARVDDMATRLLAAWHYVGGEAARGAAAAAEEDTDPAGLPPAERAAHAALIRTIGAAGTVLVKNVRGALPLPRGRPLVVAVYGADAALPADPWHDTDRFGGGYAVNAGWNTLNGTLIVGGGSGGTTPPYVVSPLQALQERVVQDGGVVRWDVGAGGTDGTDGTEEPAMAGAADVCVVCLNAYASESFDRPSLTDAAGDRLVGRVAGGCANTVVVVHAAGIRLVDAWVDHANVTAVLLAGLPGQEAGHSLADVLYGDVNPSGRLPYTVARRAADYGALLGPSRSAAYFPEDDFAEGLFTDYRAFDRDGRAPRFPFGFGLSYTAFAYGDFAAALVGAGGGGGNDDDGDAAAPAPAELPDPAVPVAHGGHPQLWDTVAVVRCTVANRGAVAGAEVVQLYVGVPGARGEAGPGPGPGREDLGDSPVRQLRGFQRVGPLAPGETAAVALPLTRRDLSVWDTAAQQWRLRRGTYRLYVGASSRDLRLNGTLTL